MQTQTEEFTPDEDGNYSSPALRALVGVWDDYDLEEADEDEVLRVVANVEAFVRQKLAEMEKDAEAPDVDAFDPNRTAIFGAFQDHLTALKTMREALETGDGEKVDHSFEILQSATNRMVQGLGGLIEDEARYARIRCVQCSHENAMGTSYCAGCGAILPKIEQENTSQVLAEVGLEGEGEDEVETTPSYIEVSEAHEAWSEGSFDAEGFHGVLNEVRERQVAQYQATEKTLLEMGEEEDALRDYLSRVLSGLEANAEALDQMMTGLEDGDEEQIEEGLNAFSEATLHMVELDRRGEELGLTDSDQGES